MSKRLSEMNDDEAAAMLARIQALVSRALPAGTFDGEAGFFMVILDVDGEQVAQCHIASNIPRDRVPELLHQLADNTEQEIDAEEAERGDDYEPLKDEDGGN